jgi:hypothetical protein
MQLMTGDLSIYATLCSVAAMFWCPFPCSMTSGLGCDDLACNLLAHFRSRTSLALRLLKMQ